jgi:hypothetical protein
MDQLIHESGDMRGGAVPSAEDEKPQPLTRKEASAYLRDHWSLSYCVRTLAAYAVRGTGPEYSKAGPKAVYTRAALDRWARTRLTAASTKASELKPLSEIDDGSS